MVIDTEIREEQKDRDKWGRGRDKMGVRGRERFGLSTR